MSKVFLIKGIILSISLLFAFYLFEPKSKTTEDLFYEKASIIADRTDYFGRRIDTIAASFVGIPYLHSEDVKHDSLTVRFDSLNCWTYVETVVAITLSASYKHDTDYSTFLTVLKKVRYKNGAVRGYGSKYHYFLEWIDNLEQREIGQNFSEYFGETQLKKKIKYLSTNSAVRGKDSLKIAVSEHLINNKTHYFIPNEKIKTIENQLMDGDIIGFVSKRNDLDVFHIGIAHIQNCRPLFYSSFKESGVQLSEESIYDYSCRLGLGIIVFRITRGL